MEAITHVKNISKKKPTVKRLLVHIYSLGANNWDESVVEETLCILRTKGIINENYKILTTNDTNTLPSDDELLETPLVSSTDNTLNDPNLLLFQEPQFSTSTSTLPTVHSTVTLDTPTSHSRKNSNENKHDLKDKQTEQLNAELKALKSFIREELHVMKKIIEDLQDQKTTPNYSVVAESLKEELIYLKNENLTKTQIIKTITENQHLPSTSSKQNSSNTKEPSNTGPEMAHNSTIDLTENNKCKPTGSQTRDDNFQAIVNNNNNKKLKDTKTTPHKDPSKNSKSINVPRKNTLVVGDSILKHVEGWRLNKRMKSNFSVRSIPGASTNGMVHHVKGCLEDISPNTVILHHGTNDLKCGNTSEKIATDIVNLALTIQSEKTKVFISGLTIRNDNLNKRRKEVNQLLERKCLVAKLGFIDNQNINLKMLNQSGVHLNEYGTRRLFNSFCYNLMK